MNKYFLCFLFLLFAGAVYSADQADQSKVVWSDDLFIDVNQIKRGDILKGKTRMTGDEMKEFNLKVISILYQSVGEQSIFAEIEDELFYQTGVLAGMSGSPVYLEGRLAGAVAFTVPFLKKPIVGITSIRSMLRVQEYLDEKENSEPFVSSVSSYGNGAYKNGIYGKGIYGDEKRRVSEIFFPRQKSAKDFGHEKNFPNLSPDFSPNLSPDFSKVENLKQSRQLTRIKTPLTVSAGLDGQRFLNQFFATIPSSKNNSTSLVVLPTSGAINATNAGLSEEEFLKKADSLEPGDLIGVNLARGDIDVSAYGTVTYVDKDLIFAFGHAMSLAGKTALPLYKAYVDGVVPRTEISYKVGSLIKEIGVIRQDRSTAIVGRLGQKAKLIPVDLHLVSGENDKSFSFEVVNDHLYTPWLVPMTAFLTIFQYEGLQNNDAFSYKMSVEGERVIDEGGSNKKIPWKIDLEQSAFAPRSFEQNFFSVAFRLNSFFEIIFNNPYGNLNIRNVKMEVRKDPIDFLVLEGVRLEKEVYKKGEPIKMIASFRSYKKKQVEEKVINYQPPPNLRPGVHRLNFSSEFDFFWKDFNNFPEKYLGYDFPSFLKSFSQKQRNDRLVISVISRTPVLKTTGGPAYRRLPFIAGTKLVRLPSSKKDIFGDYYIYGQDFPLPILGNETVVVEIVE